MTLSITFYDDIKYHRMDFINRDLDFIGNGVVNLTDFPITYPSPANMNLSLGRGIAWVDGYRIPNDSNLVTVTVPAADPTYPRIDIIQIGHDDINSTYSLIVKKGVAASSPIEPGADPNYVKLYAINVAANVTSITSSNVIDRRALVPLKVSGTQIQYQGAASTGSNTYTGTQTAPEFASTGNMAVGGESLEINGSGSSTQYGRINQIADGTFFSKNAYYDGTNWQRDDTSKPASAIRIGPDGSIKTYYVAVGTNPITWQINNTLDDGSGNFSAMGKIAKVKNVATAGNLGVLTCVANTAEQLLSTINATDVLTYTPTIAGNYEAKLYLRCANANTQVTAVVTWYDASGNQRTNTITLNQVLNADGYSAPTAFFNATTSGPIKITVTAGAVGNIYCSASILGV